MDHISQTPVECSIFIYWHGSFFGPESYHCCPMSIVHPSHLETESLLLLRLVVTLADEDASPTLDNHVFVATR